MKEFLRQAFEIPRDPPVGEAQQRRLRDLARRLKQKNLSEAAVLVLEGTKPFHGLASQALEAARPLLASVLPQAPARRLIAALENKNAVECLIRELERTGA